MEIFIFCAMDFAFKDKNLTDFRNLFLLSNFKKNYERILEIKYKSK